MMQELQDLQRLTPEVQVDWATEVVTSTDGRHGHVCDVSHFVDHNNLRSGLHIMVHWQDGSTTMFTTIRGGSTFVQDGPCERGRVH